MPVRFIKALSLAVFLNFTTPVLALTEKEQEDVDAFVISNALHTLLHEVGHMLVSELLLPVIGQEEDAVDAYATVTLLEWQKEPETSVVVDTAIGWFLLDQKYADSQDESAYFGHHDLDIQRGARTICFVYGFDPKKNGDIADDFNLPEEQREGCVGDYEIAADSWNALLRDHFRTDDEAEQEVTVSYDIGDGEWAEVLKNAELLEEIQEFLKTNYRLPNEIKLTMESCDEPNAYWIPDERTVLFCTELADEFASIYIDEYYGKKN